MRSPMPPGSRGGQATTSSGGCRGFRTDHHHQPVRSAPSSRQHGDATLNGQTTPAALHGRHFRATTQTLLFTKAAVLHPQETTPSANKAAPASSAPPLNPFRKVPSPTPSHLHLTSWQGRSRARAHGRLHLSEQVRLSKRGSRLFLPQRHPTEAPSSSVIHEGIEAPMASISGGCLASCGTCRCGCSWKKKDQFVPPLRGHGKFHGPAWALRGAEREWRPTWNIEQS